MKSTVYIILVAIISGLIGGYIATSFKVSDLQQAKEHKETTFERVVRTNTLRCGFAAAPPMIYKDNHTGEILGGYAKIAEKMASLLELKLEWVAEVGFADFAEGLKTGRYDAFCGVLSQAPQRSRVVRFTDPIAYYPFEVYVRKGDKRFQSIAAMNKPDVKVGTIDGEVFQIITRKHLPDAQEMSLPNMSPDSQLFLDLIDGKVDVLIHSPVMYEEFEANNGDKLDKPFAKPIELYPVGFAVAPEEHEMAEMFNTALRSMHILGDVDELLTQNGLSRKVNWRLAVPYQEENEQ